MNNSSPQGYGLVWTDTFIRTARKFLLKHPGLKGSLENVLKQLEVDPFVPRLHLHRLKGKHSDKHSIRLTYSDRIVLHLKLSEHEIVLLDIGSHDDVYRDT